MPDQLTEFQGCFWLPDRPELRLPGRCACNERGRIQLDLLGSFSDHPFDGATDLPRILGVTADGRAVTLERCFYRSKIHHSPGMAVASIRVNLALIGCHFEHNEPIAFDEIACHSAAIDEWLGFNPIRVSSDGDFRQVTITYTPADPVLWTLSSGLQVQFSSSWERPPVGEEFREARVSRRTWVKFSAGTSTPLNDLLKVVHRFSRFVSFAVHQNLPLNAICGFSRTLVRRIGGSEHRVPIDIFYEADKETVPNLAKISPPFALFPFSLVRQRFGEALTSWLENYERFEASFALYFGSKSTRDLYMANRFLMLAQCLEALHRQGSSEESFSAEQYAKLCETLRNIIPGEFKEWLESRLKYGNELSLRQRLKKLFDGTDRIFGDQKRIKSLIGQIVDTRNHLTHFDPGLLPRRAEGRELYKLCLALESLFEIQMGLMCGFSQDQILDLFEKSESCRGVMRELSQ